MAGDAQEYPGQRYFVLGSLEFHLRKLNSKLKLELWIASEFHYLPIKQNDCVKTRNENLSLKMCAIQRSENITRHQNNFFQENMNEPGTRRSDTSTAIAYYIFLNRNTCSGKHLCKVPTHALINRKCINLMFRCCNQAMLTSISLQHGINSEIHFIIILFLNINVNQYIINKKFTHLKNLYLFSLPSMKPKDKEID